jgi:hypothetical protein
MHVVMTRDTSHAVGVHNFKPPQEHSIELLYQEVVFVRNKWGSILQLQYIIVYRTVNLLYMKKC